MKREAVSNSKRKLKSRRFKKKKCNGRKCKSSQSKKGEKSNIRKKKCQKNKCKSSKSKKEGQRKHQRKRNKSKSKGKRTRKISKLNNLKERQTTDYSTCFPNIFKYTVRLKKARNIQNQFKRINSSRALISKKKGKRDDFSGTLDILVSALGGDKSAPKCSQSRAFNGDFTGSSKMYIIV